MANFGEICYLILTAHEFLIAEVNLRDDFKTSDLLPIDGLDLQRCLVFVLAHTPLYLVVIEDILFPDRYCRALHLEDEVLILPLFC